MTRIVYFGPEGTFTEAAARTVVDEPGALAPVATIRGALAEVRAGTASAACVPVENSVEGAVAETMDCLAEDKPLVTVAETVLPIRFSILGRPGAPLSAVRTI